MDYEEAARILIRYSKTAGVSSLRTALTMGADELFKRAAKEKAVSCFIEEENIDIPENAPMAE